MMEGVKLRIAMLANTPMIKMVVSTSIKVKACLFLIFKAILNENTNVFEEVVS